MALERAGVRLISKEVGLSLVHSRSTAAAESKLKLGGRGGGLLRTPGTVFLQK